jgi:opacity protein-like surface antigen
MRRFPIALATALVLIAGVAQAQTMPGSPAPPRRFVEFTLGPTFGHTTSLSLGVEGGVPLSESFDVFVEGGRMRNVATSDLDAAAAIVAQFIAGTGTAKQSVGYFDGGLRYLIPTTGRYEPYVLFGVGVAKVSRSATFTVGGTDVTSQLLDRFGVQLGGDLLEDESAALVTFGVGARFNVRGKLVADASYRYARIFLAEQGLNTNRLQFGIGIRF